MKTIILAAAVLIPTVAMAAPTAEQCSAATELAVKAFEMRRAGVTEDQLLGELRSRKIYSGLPVWAVKQGISAPVGTSEWLLRGHVFGECLERAQ